MSAGSGASGDRQRLGLCPFSWNYFFSVQNGAQAASLHTRFDLAAKFKLPLTITSACWDPNCAELYTCEPNGAVHPRLLLFSVF